MTEEKQKIIIVEDAAGVADMYKRILEDEYDVTICNSGYEAQELINDGRKYDLAIMDIVLPPEKENLSLIQCQRTGIRLMKAMIAHGTCPRFYVISVIKDLKSEVEKICTEANTTIKFQYKLDCEPEELLSNIKELISK